MPTTESDARARYVALIDATLRHALTNRPPPTDGPLTMELALPAIAARMGLIDERSPALTAVIARIGSARSDARVVDGAGQTRSTYRPLLMRCVGPFEPRDRPASFRESGEAAIARCESFAREKRPIVTGEGDVVAAVALDAVAILRSRSDATLRGEGAAADVFRRLLDAQSSAGRFLASTAGDQLEPAWYHELAVLHAVSLFADRMEGMYPEKSLARDARAAVKSSARYHAAEVQPDHASSHPFGLAALLDDPDGVFLADMMLHAAGVQQPATMDAVSLVLLFDAIDPHGRPTRAG